MEEDARSIPVLERQRVATWFRILVEIADRQPAVSQREIADAIGVTTQAVSENLRELTDEGFVRKGGRGRYEISKRGVDWLFQQATALEEYLQYVHEEVLETVDVETAIAEADIEVGDTVTLRMEDGTLRAAPGPDRGGATATAMTPAAAGEDVGVGDIEGVLEYDLGHVQIVSVPPIRSGGSGAVDLSTVRSAVRGADLVAAAGTEAIATLARIDVEPDLFYGTATAVQEAAARGCDVALVCVTHRIADHTQRLRDDEIPYDIIDNYEGAS